jgi:stearoyl-CoA desaturase (Delta-9 desaturase)
MLKTVRLWISISARTAADLRSAYFERSFAIPPIISTGSELLTAPAAANTTTEAPAESKNAVVVAARKLSSAMTAIGFFAMHIGCIGIFFVEFSWYAVALGVVLYLIRGFGLTGGFHRYFAHRAYKTSRWFQFCLAVMGCAALQRGAMWWAAHHRLHHKHSDQEEDPHSPISHSVWFSHVGWVLSKRYDRIEWEQMKDFKKYPELLWLEKFDLVPGVLIGLCCLALGPSYFFWSFLFGTICLYHTTFMVNSVCHLFGTRRFETKDRSRNNAFVAMLTMGEGWHNNHHHYPSAARQGFKWWEVDLSYIILKTLSLFGIVWDLRQPTPRALAKNAIGAKTETTPTVVA